MQKNKEILNDEIITAVRRSNCFDFLRYLFAFSLILAHFCTLTNSEQMWFITGNDRVKAFFTITGFLVTYSFLRRNCEIKSYARKRFVRIIPAYVVCVVVCIILGAAVTSLSVGEFFSSSQTWKYAIANVFMANWIEPELPLTFQGNIRPQMNGSLWSMKFEVIFYVMVPMLMWIVRKTGKRWLALLLLGGYLCAYNSVSVQAKAFMFFFSGMTLLLYFDVYCKYMKYIFPIAIVAFLLRSVDAIVWLNDIAWKLEPISFPLALIGFAYHCKPLNFLRKYDNVTYGLYLYHFPVVQVVILLGCVEYGKPLALVAVFVLTAILACLSWFLIEKPLMQRYK